MNRRKLYKLIFAAQFLLPILYWLAVKVMVGNSFSPWEYLVFYYGIGWGLYFGFLIAGVVLLPALWKADIEAQERNKAS
jgi:hypothetical protein